MAPRVRNRGAARQVGKLEHVDVHEHIEHLRNEVEVYEDRINHDEPFSLVNDWWKMFECPETKRIEEKTFWEETTETKSYRDFFDTRLNDRGEPREGLPYSRIGILFFVTKQVVFSRFLVLIIQFFASDIFGNRFHTDAFRGGDALFSGENRSHAYLVRALKGFQRWDAQYFLYIAYGDYFIEKSLAFQPAFPIAMQQTGMIVRQNAAEFGVKMMKSTSLVLSGVTINYLAFYFGAFGLFGLTYQITRNVRVSLLAVSVYAYNPASIFFSALYSESLFFFITCAGLNFVLFATNCDIYYFRYVCSLCHAISVSLSSMTRSNGLLNMAYTLWYGLALTFWTPVSDSYPNERIKPLIQETAMEISRQVKDRAERSQLKEEVVELSEKNLRSKKKIVTNIFKLALGLCVMVIFCMTEMAGLVKFGGDKSNQFCFDNKFIKRGQLQYAQIFSPEELVIAGQTHKATWCHTRFVMEIFPTYYGRIQKKYWDVGFLGYWQWKKIPYFLSAAPALILTFYAAWSTYYDLLHVKKWRNILVLLGRTDHLLPYALHSLFLAILALFFINVEVFTRMVFSSSPFLYIFIAQQIERHLMEDGVYGSKMSDYVDSWFYRPMFFSWEVWRSSIWGKLLYIYFFGYFAIGTFAHAAWLPFT